jgi:hypothetical protein
MVTLHSAVLDSINTSNSMDTPRCAPPACSHSHRSGAANTFTAPLSLPVSTAADPCRGREGRSACVLTIQVSWWGVEGGHTLAPSPERAQGFRWEADAPSCTHTLHPHAVQLPPSTTLLTALHAPLPSPHSSLQLRRLEQPPHPVQAVGATVPPSVVHTG